MRRDLFSRSGFFVEDAVEYLVELRGVGQQCMKRFQISGVVAPWNPDLQISFRTVFVFEVLDCTLIMSGSVELRMIRQTILNGSADYRLCVDEAVGFGHYQSVFAAGFMTAGCSVILYSFTHYLNLLRCEPGFNKLICLKNLT